MSTVVRDDLVIGAGAWLVTLVATPFAARIATRLQLVDHPGALKPQSSATPYLGGVAVGLGVVVGVASYRPLCSSRWRWRWPSGQPTMSGHCLRCCDSSAELSRASWSRLACPLVFPGAFSFVLIVLATIVLINGFNLIDGLDALCGSGHICLARWVSPSSSTATGGTSQSLWPGQLPPSSSSTAHRRASIWEMAALI